MDWDKSMLMSASVLISDISLVLSEEDKFFFIKKSLSLSLVLGYGLGFFPGMLGNMLFSASFQAANFLFHWSYFWLQSQYLWGTIDPILAYTDLIAVNKIDNYLLLSLKIPPAVLDAFK